MNALLRDLCAEELTRAPVTASRLGADPVHDSALPDMSETGRRASAEADRRWVSRLEEIDAADDLLDRDVALAGLRGRILLRDWHIEHRGPELYTNPALLGVQALFQHRLRPAEELARDAAARLRQAPELLHHARKALDPTLASPRLLRRAARHAAAGATFCRDAAGLVRTDTGAAAEAYEQFAVFLTDLADRAHGEPAIGESRYTALLATKEGSRLDAAAVHELGTERMRQLRQDMAQLYRDHPELRTPVANPPASTEELLESYRTEVARARRFCVEHAVLTLPDGESCAVAPTPEFQEALLPVASYQPPALLTESVQSGRLLVPTRSPAAHRAAGFPNTTVHETYPGHHAHYARMAATVRAHPVRALFPSTFLTEGWGLYVEQLAHRHGYFTEPATRQAHLVSGIVRAARALLDAALHSGDMTPEQAEAYLTDNLRLPREAAVSEVDRYLAYPTQAAAYLVGATEIARIVEETDAAPHDVHNGLTSSGALPLHLAAQATG